MSQNTTSSEQENTANNINITEIVNLVDDNTGEDVDVESLNLPQSKEKKKSKGKSNDQENISDDEINKLAKKNKIKADYYDRMDKHYYKQKGFHFILGCLVGYGAIVVIDSVLQTFFDVKISSYADGFIELLKYIISTLIGFVFADTRHKDEKEK